MLSGTAWLNIGVNTLMLASMYILAASGFAFIFNMLGAINLAHGNLYMMGAFIAYAILYYLGLPVWLSILIAALLTAGFGLLLERFAIRPFKDDFSRIVMVGVALMFIFQTAAILFTGTKNLSIPLLAEGTLRTGDLAISYQKIIMFAVALVIIVIVLFITNKTKLGREMKAVSQDRLGAALMGVPINKVAAIVCAIGCFLATVAGGLMGSYQSLTSTMGDAITLRILMLVMMSGAGSMNGIIVTGLIMGFLDAFFPVVLSGTLATTVIILIVIIILLIRPKGFFGHEM